MTEDQLKQANELKEQRKKVVRELKIWEEELTSKWKLGYLQGWNKNHPVELNSSISDGVFNGFRCAAIDNLKLKLVCIDQEFSEI